LLDFLYELYYDARIHGHQVLLIDVLHPSRAKICKDTTMNTAHFQ